MLWILLIFNNEILQDIVILRFKLYKNDRNQIIEDDEGKIPRLFFTDLTGALQCLDELNRLADNSDVENFKKLLCERVDDARKQQAKYRINPFSPMDTKARDYVITLLLDERIKVYQELLEDLP